MKTLSATLEMALGKGNNAKPVVLDENGQIDKVATLKKQDDEREAKRKAK